MNPNIARTLVAIGLTLGTTASAQPERGGFGGAALGFHNEPACDSQGQRGIQHSREFTQWLGRRPDLVMDFAWYESWSNVLRSTALLTSCWRQEGYDRLAFGMPLLPNDHISTLEQGAAGAYDDYFRTAASTLVANGYGRAIIRLGWEFNIANFPWAAAKDPSAWVAYWRRVVGVMRSVPGAEFSFDWNPTVDGAYAKPGHVPPPEVYPGDDYVDIIGLDVYNEWWGDASASPQQRWQHLVEQPYGLAWQKQFAAEHGKPMSFPEWGTGARPDGHGAGDDPYFVTQMANWIATNNVAYHDYWDEQSNTYNAQLSNGQFPASADAFRRAFGGGDQDYRPHRRDRDD